jgi:hypothetical protein
MRTLVLLGLIPILAACATPAQPAPTQPPVVQTVVVPETVVAPAQGNAPRPAETHAAETRAAESAPTSVSSLTTAPKATPANAPQPQSVGITLGAPRQLMHEKQPDALGMTGIPDQPLTPILQPDKSYRLFIAGGEIGGIRGGPGLISTKDFITYTPVVGNPKEAQPVLTPSCRENTDASCADNYDAVYAGVDLVFPSSNGKDLVMIYQGVNKNFAIQVDGFYSVVALAISTDNGVTWTRRGPIITGSDPKPTNPKPGANGADQSGAIVANGYIYDFYPYFPSRSAEDSTIQAARAPVASDGAPGTWTKYYNGSFGSQPGIGGLGSPVVPSASACKRPAQPWLAFSTYLNEYVMVFVCKQGWFFSTSADLVTWTVPTQFYTAPAPLFGKDQPTDENASLVTPGNAGQVIGQTGYVLYASTPAWGKTAHMLWMRPFTFTKSQ